MFLKKLVCMVVLLFCAVPSYAAMLKAHVAEFKVTGSPDGEGLKTALQSMLASRLSGENMTLVREKENPDLTIFGTYIVFGKVFSLDGQIVTPGGKIAGRAFEQGESADDVIPAVGRLADKLSKEIARSEAATAATKTAAPVEQKAARSAPVSPDIVVPAPSVIVKDNADIIRPEGVGAAGKGGPAMRFDGVMIGLAATKAGNGDKRNLVVATEKELRLYEAGGAGLLLDAEKGFGGDEKILAIDAADIDKNGIEELYVTAFNGEYLAGRVYEIDKGKFRLVAQKLPYFFRAISLAGGEKRVYVQQTASGEDFYGPMYELVKNGAAFDVARPVKLPRSANIYNMNMLKDKDGKSNFVMLTSGGYLALVTETGEQLWKSSDRFGGSDRYFIRDDGQNMQFTGSRYRQVFLEQRITVTDDGTVIVPRNEGTFVFGNNRSYTKSSVFAFGWNGFALEEKWHTKLSQNSLADYVFDEQQKELLLLEVAKKEGLSGAGSSAISIKRVE